MASQIYVPLQTLRVEERQGKKYIISTIQVNVYTGQVVEIDKKIIENDPKFLINLEVIGNPDSLWTYPWLGKIEILFDGNPDVLYSVTAKVDSNDNDNPGGGVTNTIAGDGTIDM